MKQIYNDFSFFIKNISAENITMAIDIRKMKDKKEFALINITFSELLLLKDGLAIASKSNDKAKKLYEHLESLMNDIAI